jgi:hypothetical protein
VGKAKQQQRNQSTMNPHVLFCRGRRTRARIAESGRGRTAESLENIKVIAPGMGKTNNKVGKTKQQQSRETNRPRSQETRRFWRRAEQEQRNRAVRKTESGRGECGRKSYLGSGGAWRGAGERREWRSRRGRAVGKHSAGLGLRVRLSGRRSGLVRVFF